MRRRDERDRLERLVRRSAPPVLERPSAHHGPAIRPPIAMGAERAGLPFECPGSDSGDGRVDLGGHDLMRLRF